MEFQAALGILVVIGFGYFIYKKVKESKAGKGGGGSFPKDPPGNEDPR